LLPPNASGYLNTTNPAPALPTLIRKLVLIGSPNFGITTQLEPLTLINGGPELHGSRYQYPPINLPGDLLPDTSTALFALNTWNQRGDDLRGVDAIAIAGNGDPVHSTDGLVSVNSASITFTGWLDADQRTRVIPYCHGSILLGPCSGDGIASVNGPDHPSYKIIRSFLDGTDAWKTVGVSASAASKTGGVWALPGGALIGCMSGNEGGGNPCGHWPTLGTTGVTDSPGVIDSYTGKQLPTGPPLLPASTGHYWDFNAPGPLTVSYNHFYNDASPFIAPRRKTDITIQPGGFQLAFDWVGYSRQGAPPTKIDSGGIVPANGWPTRAHSLTPGTAITIHGQSLGPAAPVSSPNPVLQLGGTSITIIDYFPLEVGAEISSSWPCLVTYASTNRIDAVFPAGVPPGWHWLMVTTAQGDAGKDVLNIMVEK
jgi:hypothetical protein